MSTITVTDFASQFQECIALYHSRQLQESLNKLTQLETSFPGNIDIKYLCALCLMELGNLDDAEKLLNECEAEVKNSDELYSGLGMLANAKGKVAEAVDYYSKALALNPNNLASLNNLGNIYNDTGQNDLALQCFNKIINLGVKEYFIYNNISLVYKKIGALHAALEAIQKAIDLNPTASQGYHNAALILVGMGNKQTALECYEHAFKYAPDNIQLVSEYRDLCTNVCDWDKYDELDKHFNKLLEAGHKLGLMPPMTDIQKNINPQQNLEAAIQYTNYLTKNVLLTQTPYVHDLKLRLGRKKIRIGYISSDIKDHPVSHLMRGVFQSHNKDEFEIYLYSSSEDIKDDLSGYRDAIIKCADVFVDTRPLSNSEIARRIYEDQIDIIIDLNGHTGTPRLEALALKPAPVQISYIGYIGSMGADFIDYIITDKIVTPPDQQKYYLEKFLYMPNCYQANDDSLEISEKPTTRAENNLPEDAFVFCSFNQTYKIEPVLFEIWMNILKRVPNSVLWLYKGSIFINDNLAKHNLWKNAGRFGVSQERIIFSDGILIDQHLKRVGLADLALDTRVYNGGTVTSQTLWAGVPVLTLMGGHYASRMASSIVTAVGMPEMVTHSLQEYEDLAVKIATTKGEAKRLKEKLANNKNVCSLFDTKKFTKDLESLYKNVWEELLRRK